ncbi:hypothetical protein [Pontibacter akesuensis]|uniref:Late embryogenesis abundant protein n=1 Tax=Pontibacter akesuensis TaxID=388950 RepID=A0A1I7KHA8_9BACT|nr:hypothetical protein [Pontibacter akesuensis]GHA79040.1 hypothetical protein GCM10007389_36430 [Pontibacter akesuensis]SFU96813.1 hypothetical protein SAMN04487941_3745 [Pontibacter akesuensis]
MNKYKTYLWFLLLVFSASCKQASDLKAFTEAKYSLQEVQDVTLNGVDVMQKRGPNDFTTQEGDSLLASISDNKLQASTTLHLNVQLPEAGEDRSMEITKLRWQLLVDGEQTLQGVVNEPMHLREGLNELPIHTTVMMSEAEGIRNYEGLSKLMTLLAKREDLRKSLTLQIRPTVQTPVGAVEVPQFITVSKPAGTM